MKNTLGVMQLSNKYPENTVTVQDIVDSILEHVTIGKAVARNKEIYPIDDHPILMIQIHVAHTQSSCVYNVTFLNDKDNSTYTTYITDIRDELKKVNEFDLSKIDHIARASVSLNMNGVFIFDDINHQDKYTKKKIVQRSIKVKVVLNGIRRKNDLGLANIASNKKMGYIF